MSWPASRTCFGPRRLTAPRSSSLPHGDGHQTGPMGVSAIFASAGCGWPRSAAGRWPDVNNVAAATMPMIHGRRGGASDMGVPLGIVDFQSLGDFGSLVECLQ